MKSRHKNLSGTEIKAVYTPDDISQMDIDRDIGIPGKEPFLRGIHGDMYRGKPWTMRLFSGFGSAEETNKRYKYLLDHGETGLSVAFDYPTLYGYDTDHKLARGEFGKCGVAISSLQDMELLFDGIHLEKITTSMTINGPAAIIWAMYLANAEKQGIPFEKIGGTIQNDILKEYIAQKSFIFPPEPSMRLIVDTFEFGSKHVPRWNTISISGYHIREAGSTAVQELAFTLADGITYVKAAKERGLDIDHFAPRLSFFFNCHNDFFEEIAKYRAARRIWCREMKKLGAKNPRSLWMRFHTQTAGCALTAQQPENNIARVAIQALAAVLGGTQSLHTNSMDETMALPTEQAVTVALRTQQIIAEESGVANTVDPLGGSFFVEQLTNGMEEKAMEYIRKIDEMGGMVAAIKQGYPQREVADAAFHFQRLVDAGKKRIVGLNAYQSREETLIPLLKIDDSVEKQQVARTKEVRRRRDAKKARACLSALKEGSLTPKVNLMPLLVEAAREYVTLGEMCDTLRETMGVYTDPAMF